MLSNGICSGRTRFRLRTSCGSMPASCATASSKSSRAKHTPVRATPRYGKIGHLLVATEKATPVGRKIIRSRKNARHLRGFQAGGERVRRVGAGIDDGFAIDTAQAAVAVGVGRDAVMVLTAIGANQVLAPVLDPSNRMAAMHGEPAEAFPPATGCPCSQIHPRHPR